ncbi:MAG: hypothetical protein HC906_00015 [Bacteroidales bacterium]|nr:hypothetical protein [Bacteroidales bacterium]
MKEIKEKLTSNENLPIEFVHEMNSLLPAHENLSKAISVEDLKDFSIAIIKHSEIYQIDSLCQYGKRLYTYAENCNLIKF